MTTNDTARLHYQKQLATLGLRLANPDERGWYAIVWQLDNTSTVKVWATEQPTQPVEDR